MRDSDSVVSLSLSGQVLSAAEVSLQSVKNVRDLLFQMQAVEGRQSESHGQAAAGSAEQPLAAPEPRRASGEYSRYLPHRGNSGGLAVVGSPTGRHGGGAHTPLHIPMLGSAAPSHAPSPSHHHQHHQLTALNTPVPLVFESPAGAAAGAGSQPPRRRQSANGPRMSPGQFVAQFVSYLVSDAVVVVAQLEDEVDEFEERGETLTVRHGRGQTPLLRSLCVGGNASLLRDSARPAVLISAARAAQRQAEAKKLCSGTAPLLREPLCAPQVISSCFCPRPPTRSTTRRRCTTWRL